MKNPPDPLDAEIHEMLDFYWNAARRSDATRAPKAATAAPARRRAVAFRKLTTLRATRLAERASARTATRQRRSPD